MHAEPVSLLRRATLIDGRVADIAIAGDTVTEVLPAGTALVTDAARTVDLTGYVLLPAAAEPHAHLDKALTWDMINPPFGDLEHAIESFHAFQEHLSEEDIYNRARTAALKLLRTGTTAIRSHVNILPGDRPYRGVDALVRLRHDLAGLVDLELVALPPVGMDDETIEGALDRGLDLAGGAPHLAADPHAEVRRLLAIADRRGIGVDLHTDESLDGPLTMREFARIVREWPEHLVRTAGHSVRLGTLPAAELAVVIAELIEAGIGVVSLPITNLYLQGRRHPVSTPRGLTALRSLIDAGAIVGAGADNVRDPFNPLGRSDALETAALLVLAGHLDLEDSWHLVSNGARAVMRMPPAGAAPGAAAEFVAVRGASLGEVIAEASAERIVIHAGRVVARSTVDHQIAEPAPQSAGPLIGKG
ncbi:amidohydrolase family protein [Agromyces sp. ISL-38]|uniref:amidohydrolase family protein n=1 Tax=Agromyces sp. ISL-38 TaxID=2819107 RepID=UPI001BEAD147|nr:amidohydrolase family protein [Agromyces sp. ISL-38]MBT2497878.1 amidohydrolase family protein [Agromyces sp. ISL-38]MBT2517032.1 amidohydrolase family protein [Streptomyces sp. ISL-90]